MDASELTFSNGVDCDAGLDDGPLQVYERLDVQTTCIRLIKVFPYRGNDSVSCVLTTHMLQDVDSFVALSYAWGKPDSGQSVTVNGKTMLVRENLWSFLLQTSKLPDRSASFYWIDALCINQSDMVERTHQVQMMGDIYSRAESVLVCLGPSIERRYSMRGIMTEIWVGPQSEQGFAALDLCERAYWSRLWVVQELRKAKRIVVTCGDGAVSFQHFWEWVKQMSDDGAQSGQPGAESRALKDSAAMSMIETVSHSYQQPYLYDLIHAFRHLQCADPRDKIYALLGVAELGQQDVRPDYTISLVQILRRVLATHLEVKPAKSLRAVIDHCAYLGSAVGLHAKSLLSFEEATEEQRCLDDAVLRQFPLHDGIPSGVEAQSDLFLMLWWAEAHGIPGIYGVWCKEYDASAIEKRILRAVTNGQESFFKLIWERRLLDPSNKRISDAIISRGSPYMKALLLRHLDFDVNRLDIGQPLIERAIHSRDRVMLQLLLERPELKFDDCNAVPASSWPILVAAETGQEDVAILLIERRLLTWAFGAPHYCRLMQTAIRRGMTTLVRQLRCTGTPNPDSWFYLSIEAVRASEVKTLQVLLEKSNVGVDQNRLLEKAVELKSWNILNYLLSREDVDLIFTSRFFGGRNIESSPLGAAIRNGRRGQLKALLNRGKSIDWPTELKFARRHQTTQPDFSRPSYASYAWAGKLPASHAGYFSKRPESPKPPSRTCLEALSAYHPNKSHSRTTLTIMSIVVGVILLAGMLGTFYLIFLCRDLQSQNPEALGSCGYAWRNRGL